MTGPDGTKRRIENLTRRAEGYFVITFTRQAPAGAYQIQLFGQADGNRQVVDTYHFTLAFEDQPL